MNDSNGGKLLINIVRNAVGKFGTNVGTTKMGVNFMLILVEMNLG